MRPAGWRASRARTLTVWADEHGLWHADVTARTAAGAERCGRRAIHRARPFDSATDLIVETVQTGDDQYHVAEV